RLSDGCVLLVGSPAGNSVATELFQPSGGAWTHSAGTAHPIHGHTPTLLSNGPVLIAGRAGGGDVGPSLVQIYVPQGAPAPNVFVPGGVMNTARTAQTATLLPNGDVLVTGGFDQNATPTASAELYEATTGLWKTVAPMSVARAEHTATRLVNGTVLVVG